MQAPRLFGRACNRLAIAAALLFHFGFVTATATDETAHDGGCVAEGHNICEADNGGPSPPNEATSQQCGMWLAESTIPGAGLGVYTGKDLQDGDVLDYPELAIPLVDMSFHNGWEDEEYRIWFWYLMNYVHNPDSAGVINESEEGVVFVPGIGAIPACHYALNNNEEAIATYDTLGLHRSRDPGAGAFAGYHDRWAYMIRSVPAGAELFSDYSENWFEQRTEIVGYVPFEENYFEAEKFLREYKMFLNKHRSMTGDLKLRETFWDLFTEDDTERFLQKFHSLSGDLESLKYDLWHLIKSNPLTSERTRNALPKSSADANLAMEIGLQEYLLRESTRSQEWFEKKGKCMDNIKPGNSTTPQAGRGAFATRFIPKGGIVGPAPLLHIPNRDILNIYQGHDERDTSSLWTYQLLLNYCFGHRHSSVLLCPYGSTTGYINHSSNKPNAKVVWAEDSVNHDAECLKKTVDELEQHDRSCAAIDFVATRDINPGEEVFIDYGAEWEEAWNKHVRDWEAPEDSDDYVRASSLNRDFVSPIKTEEEQSRDPYSDNVEIRCYIEYEHAPVASRDWNKQLDGNSESFLCNVISRTEVDGNFIYSAALDGARTIIKNIPREGIELIDSQYSGDEFLPGAFRHAMMLPDELLPKAWKNLVYPLPSEEPE